MKKKEIIVIGIIAFLAIFYLVYNFLIKSEAHTYAEVKDLESGEVLLRFDVNEDAYYEFEVPNGFFHVEVKDGHYHAVDVDCPNQDCVNFGWMPSLGVYTPIICIPNGIMVEVVDE